LRLNCPMAKGCLRTRRQHGFAIEMAALLT